MRPRSLSRERTPVAFALRTVIATAVMVATSPGDALLFSNDRPVAMVADPARPANHGFDGIGRIACGDITATAWVVGGADTIVTAAHLFFGDPGAGSPAARQPLDPGACRFTLYDAAGRPRDTARIRYALSPWAQAGRRFDSAYDMAVIKLDRAVAASHIPTVRADAGRDARFAELIAFHSGVADPERPRLTRGTLDLFPASQLRFTAADTRITRAARLFSTSADSTPGSSGGMYYDYRTGAAFGLHVGQLCDTSRAVFRYDPATCFNYGLRFDDKAVALIAAAVADRPAADDLVRAPARQRMASL